MNRSYSFYLIALTITVLLAACGQPAELAEPAPAMPDATVDADVEPTSVIQVAEQHQIAFFNDSEAGTLMLESSPAQDTSALSMLAEALDTTPNALTASEVFWALSEPGQSLPEFMALATQSSPSAQGWFRNNLRDSLSERTIIPFTIACNNNSFINQLNTHMQYNEPLIALDQIPAYSGHFEGKTIYYYPTLANSYRYFFDVIVKTDRWYGSLCGKAVENSSNSHMVNGTYYGPRLSFRYHNGNNWQSIASVVIPANYTLWYHYVWNSGAYPYRYLGIGQAKAYDQFDIAMDPEPLWLTPH